MKILKWKDIRRITGVTKNRIVYAVQRGRLEGFTMINGAYVFTEEDVVRIREHFARLKPWQRPTEQKTQQQGDPE